MSICASLCRSRNHRMWLIAAESLASLVWVIALLVAIVLAVLNVIFGNDVDFFGIGFAWGIAICVVATIQLVVAVALRYRYDPWACARCSSGAIYPLLFWIVSACRGAPSAGHGAGARAARGASRVGHPARTARHRPAREVTKSQGRLPIVGREFRPHR